MVVIPGRIDQILLIFQVVLPSRSIIDSLACDQKEPTNRIPTAQPKGSPTRTGGNAEYLRTVNPTGQTRLEKNN